MSEQERARRLPVFVDEDQWARAYIAARESAELMFSQGLIELSDGCTVSDVATRIATAALRAAALDTSGDIGDVPGVHIDEIRSHTDIDRTGSSHRHIDRDRDRDRSSRRSE